MRLHLPSFAGWFAAALIAGAAEPPGIGRSDTTDVSRGPGVADLVVAIPPPVPGGGMVWADGETTLECPPRAGGQRLVAQLDEPMPPDTWLEVEVLGTGARPGFQPLQRRGLTLALHPPGLPSVTLTLRYRFRHGVHASPGSFSRAILFTLLDP